MFVKLSGVVLALMLAFVSIGTPAAQASHITVGEYAYTTTSLRLRTGPGTGYSIKRVIPDGRQVYVRSGTYNGVWYRVRYDGTSGYVHGTYLTKKSGGSSTRSYSSKGEAIAATARRYVGYSYCYAGTSPSCFDCSGLIYYVMKQHGIYAPPPVRNAATYGRWVSLGSIRPGDMIVFANTYKPGISHAGIYVGDGYMVHASNPSSGVKMSYIHSDYYMSHYYGTVRFT